MSELGLKVRYPKKFKVTTDSNHNDATSPNKLNRQFTVELPNKAWATDITYVWTLEGWIYVAVVIDLFSRQVVGWAINDHMRTSLCVDALQMAFCRRKPKPGLFLQAIDKFDVDCDNSWMIGDSERDIEAAVKTGIGHTVFFDPDNNKTTTAQHKISSPGELAALLR